MPSAKRERQREGRMARVAAAQAEHQRRQRWRTVRNFGIIVVVIVAAIFFLSLRNGDDKKPVSTTSASSASDSPTVTPAGFTYGSGACPNGDGSSPRTIDFAAPPQQCIDPAKTYTATFETSAGNLVFALDTKTTPGTTNNFVVLARYHYYDNTQLFRTSKSIGIIQGGSPHDNTSADKGPGYALPDEGFNFASLPQGRGGPYKYSPGDLIMARAAKANGASAQFFFAVDQATSTLDSQGVYVKFGSATQGLDILQLVLASAPADEQPPSPPVTINKVTITES